MTPEEELAFLIAEQEKDMRSGDRVYSMSLDAPRATTEGQTRGLIELVYEDEAGIAVLPTLMGRRFKERLSDQDARHGTVNGYSNLGCRCEQCRKAWASYCAKAKQRRALGIVGRNGGRAPEHGTVTRYANWSCRCPLCQQAQYEAQVRRGNIPGTRPRLLVARFASVIAKTHRRKSLSPEVRLHHSYREPVVGMCMGKIEVGAWMFGRCSRRASVGDYCATHARKAGLVEVKERCEEHTIGGRQCRNQAKVDREGLRVCRSHARFADLRSREAA